MAAELLDQTVAVRAMAAPWNAAVELIVRVGNPRWGTCNILKPTGEIVAYEPNLRVEPSIRLEHDAAQTLMDDLWNAGLRPTEGSGSAGSLRATENHLKDMQKLVFEYLCKPSKLPS